MAFDDEIRDAQQELEAARLKSNELANSETARLRLARSELAAIGHEAIAECHRRNIPVAAAVNSGLKNTIFGDVWTFSLRFMGWSLGSNLFLREDGVFFSGSHVKPNGGHGDDGNRVYEKGRAKAMRKYGTSTLFFADQEYRCTGSAYDSFASDWPSSELVMDESGTLLFQRSSMSFRSLVGRGIVEAES